MKQNININNIINKKSGKISCINGDRRDILCIIKQTKARNKKDKLNKSVKKECVSTILHYMDRRKSVHAHRRYSEAPVVEPELSQAQKSKQYDHAVAKNFGIC